MAAVDEQAIDELKRGSKPMQVHFQIELTEFPIPRHRGWIREVKSPIQEHDHGVQNRSHRDKPVPTPVAAPFFQCHHPARGEKRAKECPNGEKTEWAAKRIPIAKKDHPQAIEGRQQKDDPTENETRANHLFTLSDQQQSVQSDPTSRSMLELFAPPSHMTCDVYESLP